MSNVSCIIFFCNTYSTLEWYCYFVLLLSFLVLLTGFLGNTFTVLYYICTVKSWTSSTIFLFNLALCDSTWILLTPFSVYYHLHKQEAHSTPIFCQFKRIFFDINIYGSIYFLTLISFDRYVNAAHPIRSLRWWNKSRAAACSAAVWLFIFIESVPDFYYTFVVQRQRRSAACLDNIDKPLHFVVPFTIFRVLCGFLIPITVIFTSYALTLKAIQKMKNSQQRKHRIVKPLMLVSAAMIVFAVAFVPYHVMMIAVMIYRMNNQLSSNNILLIFTMYKLTEMICSFSSCLNPIIFMLATKKFQDKFKSIQCSPHHRYCCCQAHRVRDIAQL